jgi:hypothetical protein
MSSTFAVNAGDNALQIINEGCKFGFILTQNFVCHVTGRTPCVCVRACVCKQDAERNNWYQGEEVRGE